MTDNILQPPFCGIKLQETRTFVKLISPYKYKLCDRHTEGQLQLYIPLLLASDDKRFIYNTYSTYDFGEKMLERVIRNEITLKNMLKQFIILCPAYSNYDYEERLLERNLGNQ